MHRTRVVAMAMLVPVVVAVVAAVLAASSAQTAPHAAVTVLAEGGNRGW